MTDKVPSFSSYFNPFSQEHKALENSQKLGGVTQLVIWAVSIIAGICLPVVGGIALFRALVERVSTDLPPEVRETADKISKAASAVICTEHIEDLQKDSKTQKFASLCQYIVKKYPQIDMSAYETIADLERAGHPLHFAVKEEDDRLLKKVLDAGADVTKVDGEGKTALDVLLLGDLSSGTNDCFRRKISMLVLFGARPLKKDSIKSLIAYCSGSDEKWLQGIIREIANKEDAPAIINALLVNKNLSLDSVSEYLEKSIHQDGFLDLLMLSGIHFGSKRGAVRRKVGSLVQGGARPSGIEPIKAWIGCSTEADENWLGDVISGVSNPQNASSIAHAIIDNNQLSVRQRGFPAYLIRPLFEKALDPNATDENGRSLLSKAIDRVNLSLVQILLEKGASRDVTTPVSKEETQSLLQLAQDKEARLLSTVKTRWKSPYLKKKLIRQGKN